MVTVSIVIAIARNRLVSMMAKIVLLAASVATSALSMRQLVCFATSYNDGDTQNTLKERFRHHFNDTVALVRGTRESSDSFSRHMASHFPAQSMVHAKDIREHVRVRVKWKADPLKAMKTFQSRSCILCVNEKVSIYLQSLSPGNSLMNSRLRWDEACHHRAHFHRFKFCASTDEDVYPERVGSRTRSEEKDDRDLPSLASTSFSSSDSSVQTGEVVRDFEELQLV